MRSRPSLSQGHPAGQVVSLKAQWRLQATWAGMTNQNHWQMASPSSYSLDRLPGKQSGAGERWEQCGTLPCLANRWRSPGWAEDWDGAWLCQQRGWACSAGERRRGGGCRKTWWARRWGGAARAWRGDVGYSMRRRGKRVWRVQAGARGAWWAGTAVARALDCDCSTEGTRQRAHPPTCGWLSLLTLLEAGARRPRGGQ